MPSYKRKYKKKFYKKNGFTPSSSTMMYKGPAVPKNTHNQASLFSLLCCFDYPCSSSAGGNIEAVFAINPSSIPVSNWANIVSVFDEYRVLSLKVTYVPNYTSQNPVTDTTSVVMASAVDHDSTTAPTTYVIMANYESCKYKSLDREQSQTWKMSGADEALFTNASAPVSLGSIKFFATGCSISATYGRFLGQMLIQFRGKGI